MKSFNDLTAKRRARDVKYQYFTSEEVDAQQAEELIAVLENWRSGQSDLCQLLTSTLHILGAYTSYTSFVDYEVMSFEQMDSFARQGQWERKDVHKFYNKLHDNIRRDQAHFANHLDKIFQKLKEGEITSWIAGKDILTLLMVSTHNKEYDLISNIDSVAKKYQSESDSVDLECTIRNFAPQSEDDAKSFLKKWDKHPIDFSGFFEDLAKGGSQHPDEFLVHDISITPDGVATIEPYYTMEDPCDRRIYGYDLAQITTYTIKFGTRHVDEYVRLRGYIDDALRLLPTIDYDYDLPDRHDGYRREYKPTYEENREKEKSGKSHHHTHIIGEDIVVNIKLDLDDIYRLYYLLEPIIKPSTKIAQTLNNARFVEERGAVTLPEEWHVADEDLPIEDESYFIDKDDPDPFKTSLRNALRDFAIGKDNAAEFKVRSFTIAHHTLTGQLNNPSNLLPTYTQMITDGQQKGTAIATFEQALFERRELIIRDALGITDSKINLDDGIDYILKHLRSQLKREFQAHALAIHEDREEVRQIRESAPIPELHEIFAIAKGHLMAIVRSDLNAGKKVDVSEMHKIDGYGEYDYTQNDSDKTNALTSCNLAVRESQVRFYMDGMHGGVYRSKSAGSPFVRKGLPKSLEPFLQAPPEQRVSQALLPDFSVK